MKSGDEAANVVSTADVAVLYAQHTRRTRVPFDVSQSSPEVNSI